MEIDPARNIFIPYLWDRILRKDVPSGSGILRNVAAAISRIFILETKYIEIEEHIYKYKQKYPKIVYLLLNLKNLMDRPPDQASTFAYPNGYLVCDYCP